MARKLAHSSRNGEPTHTRGAPTIHNRRARASGSPTYLVTTHLGTDEYFDLIELCELLDLTVSTLLRQCVRQLFDGDYRFRMPEEYYGRSD